MKSWYEPGLHECPQLHIISPDTPLRVLHQATDEQKQVLQNDTGQACMDSKGTRKMVLETYILSRSMLKVYIFPCNFRDMSKDKIDYEKRFKQLKRNIKLFADTRFSTNQLVQL